MTTNTNDVRSHEGLAAWLTGWLSEELNLDAAQKAKVEPILQAAQQKARAASGASSGQGQGRDKKGKH